MPQAANSASVRNRVLHDQLRAFAELAAGHLTHAVESGIEIPFEVSERPGQSSVLYTYTPLSDHFVRERFGELRKLEGFGAALLALGKVEGLSAYLRVLGISYVPASERDRAEAALREFLARVWDEVSSFEVDETRFERAYRELEAVVYENTVVNTVLAPVFGVRLEAERWDLGSGIELVRGDLIEAPAEAVWSAAPGEHEPNALLVMTVETTPKDPPPLGSARLTFRRFLTALRLFKSGSAALGPTGWWRLDDSPWQTLALGHTGRTRPTEHRLEEAHREELSELFEIVRLRPLAGGALPWALARFEMGCEQLAPVDGLSDHLLAARALLDGGESTPAGLTARLAALCAEPAQRADLEADLRGAIELERLMMSGDLDGDARRIIATGSPEEIAREVEERLRAVLRDMVCGYLHHDVRRLADELLQAESARRPEPRVEDARPERVRRGTRRQEPVVESWDEVVEPVQEPPDAEEPREPEFADEPAPRKRQRAATSQRTASPKRKPARQRKSARERKREQEQEAGEQETQETIAVGGFDWHRDDDVADWGFDDDPSDFSAAV